MWKIMKIKKEQLASYYPTRARLYLRIVHCNNTLFNPKGMCNKVQEVSLMVQNTKKLLMKLVLKHLI